MNYEALTKAVNEDAALRRRQRLQPVGGVGDKIFPPTYPPSDGAKRALGKKEAPPRHIFEVRRIGGEYVWCVLVDSVQSQANRLEEALLDAISDGVDIPYAVVDLAEATKGFAEDGLKPLPDVTSLDAPHRVYDAILRDSELDGKPFMESETGRALKAAKPNDATALLETSPTALLFGAWHSTGEGGGLGAKFPRCIVAEIIAVNTPVKEPARAEAGFKVSEREAVLGFRTDPGSDKNYPVTAAQRTGSRIDPLGILRKVEVYKGASGWDTNQKDAGKGAKKVRPSEINHGNIAPSVQPLGVTCDYAEQTAVITFAGLRRLGFGGGEKEVAGRTYLAALGLLALTELDARGYALRSRCDLVCDGVAPLELVYADGSAQALDITRETARKLYAQTLDAAQTAGFTFADEPLRLTPQEKLVEIIRQSQGLALADEGGEAENGDD